MVRDQLTLVHDLLHEGAFAGALQQQKMLRTVSTLAPTEVRLSNLGMFTTASASTQPRQFVF